MRGNRGMFEGLKEVEMWFKCKSMGIKLAEQASELRIWRDELGPDHKGLVNHVKEFRLR